jgi:hypothetical protein
LEWQRGWWWRCNSSSSGSNTTTTISVCWLWFRRTIWWIEVLKVLKMKVHLLDNVLMHVNEIPGLGSVEWKRW